MVVKKRFAKKAAPVKKAPVKAATIRARRRAVKANDEVADEEIVDKEIVDDAGEVDVAPDASDLLFEAEDVAELVAEVTGMDVAVTADEDTVTFEVGDDKFVVEAEGDEEVLEASTRLAKKNKVTASKKVLRRRAARK